jgi:hypothetical protein
MKIVVPADSVKSGTKKNGKGLWRQQRVLAHCADGQVRALSMFLFDDEKPLDVGEYVIDLEKALTVGDVTRIDKVTGQIRTEPGFVIALRPASFLRAQVSPPKVAGLRA